jgi:hypothetical protein
LGDAPHGYPQSQTLSPQVPQKATVGLGCSRRPTEDRPIGCPGTCPPRGPMGLCISSIWMQGRDLGPCCGRVGREIVEVRQRQRWRSEGIGNSAAAGRHRSERLGRGERIDETRTGGQDVVPSWQTKPRRFSDLGAPPCQDGCALLLRMAETAGSGFRARSMESGRALMRGRSGASAPSWVTSRRHVGSAHLIHRIRRGPSNTPSRAQR